MQRPSRHIASVTACGKLCGSKGANVARSAARQHRVSQTGVAAVIVTRLGLASLALALAAAAPSPTARAALYKWVDEKGIVHYTDKLPPHMVNRGNVELNPQGVTINRTEPTPTPEQRRAREIEAERQKQLAREQELIDRRDRALLSTYTTESEIDLARDRALNTIDAQVQSSNAYSVLLNKRRDELEARRKALADKPLPPAMERELINVYAELDKQVALLDAKQKEIAVVNARYDADKLRWAELRAMAAKAAGLAPASAPSPAVPPTPTTARK